MRLTVPVELVSESNVREHWAKKGNRKKKQRRAVRQAWLLAGQPVLPSLMMLKLTRVCTSRRKIRDFDNLVGCFKAVIDEIADIAGIDDKDVFWPEKRKEGFQQVVGESMECVIEIIDMTRIGEELTELQAEFLGCWIERSEELGILSKPQADAGVGELERSAAYGLCSRKGLCEKRCGCFTWNIFDGTRAAVAAKEK